MRFMEEHEISSEDFNKEVRIILISSNFNKEITTSVLWLIDNEIDITCIRLIPQRDETQLYFDLQQIIPLPEATSYQVRLREKLTEQKKARRATGRDYSRFTVSINGKIKTNLSKRDTIRLVISESVNYGLHPEEIAELVGIRRIFIDGNYTNREEFERARKCKDPKFDSTRWFIDDSDLICFNGKTYAFSNQQMISHIEGVKKLFKKYPELQGQVTKNGQEDFC